MNTQFLIDAAGHKTAVVLPIEDFRALLDHLEDLEDRRVIEARRGEPTITIESLEQLRGLVDAEDRP